MTTEITISRTNKKEGYRLIRNETSRYMDIEFKEIYKSLEEAQAQGDKKALAHWKHVIRKRADQIQSIGYVMDYTKCYGNMSVTVYGIEEWNGARWVEKWQ